MEIKRLYLFQCHCRREVEKERMWHAGYRRPDFVVMSFKREALSSTFGIHLSDQLSLRLSFSPILQSSGTWTLLYLPLTLSYGHYNEVAWTPSDQLGRWIRSCSIQTVWLHVLSSGNTEDMSQPFQIFQRKLVLKWSSSCVNADNTNGFVEKHRTERR